MPIEILLSRLQFALTLSFHILFPSLTIGLSGYLALWEIQWRRTGRREYYQLCRFWTKIFALAFGMGVVSGLVLSYEFGTNFAKFSETVGNVLGPLMSYEVLTAFFLEAGFLGIMLFGWKRVSPAMHLASTLLVTCGTTISAFWILAANSWMHTPAGYRIEKGVFFADDWLRIIFNPSFPYRFAHMVTASYLTTSFVIAGVSAWYILKQRHLAEAKAGLSLALGFALVLAPLQAFIGDMHGLNTLEHQPTKIAAIEGRWETGEGVPLTLFAIPDMKAEANRYAVEVPHLGSLILTHAWNGKIVGLKDVPPGDRPYVPLVFFSFRVMVGVGLWLITLACAGQLQRMRGKLYNPGLYHKLLALSAPLGFVAVIAGWFTTETGRQPWIVYGLLRTRDMASRLVRGEVLVTCVLFALLYGVLITVFLLYTVAMVKKGPDAPASDTPDRLTPWLEKTP